MYSRGDKASFMPLFPLAENAFYTQNLLAVNSLLMLTLVFKFLELSPKLNVLTQVTLTPTLTLTLPNSNLNPP